MGKQLTRRDVLRLGLGGACAVWLARRSHMRLLGWQSGGQSELPGSGAVWSDAVGGASAGAQATARGTQPGTIDPRFVRPARFYHQETLVSNCAACHSPVVPAGVGFCHTAHPASMLRCDLCPRRCVIADGERGHCRVRENRGGRLFTLVYGSPCSMNIDPIEKKPFFHFLPTAATFSIACAGCNLDCLYCQNWTISQAEPEDVAVTPAGPEDIARLAKENGCQVVAYTYSEPIVALEYVLETARAVRRAGLKNVVVTAASINPSPLAELCRTVDAIKVDLKGFNEDFYRRVCNGQLAPVLAAIQQIHRSQIHLEIVNLVVPTLNDASDDLRQLCRWLVETVGPDVPLHFSRFHPDYRLLDLPPTPVEKLDEAYAIARQAGCHYVYVGNVPGHRGNNTYCPSCGQLLVQRDGFWVSRFDIVDGCCRYCGRRIPGVWGTVNLDHQAAPLSEPARRPDS